MTLTVTYRYYHAEAVPQQGSTWIYNGKVIKCKLQRYVFLKGQGRRVDPAAATAHRTAAATNNLANSILNQALANAAITMQQQTRQSQDQARRIAAANARRASAAGSSASGKS